MKYPTNFIESNVILALLNDNDQEALQLLQELLPGEILALEIAAYRLVQMCKELQ